jgi:hypothetical protein
MQASDLVKTLVKAMGSCLTPGQLGRLCGYQPGLRSPGSLPSAGFSHGIRVLGTRGKSYDHFPLFLPSGQCASSHCAAMGWGRGDMGNVKLSLLHFLMHLFLFLHNLIHWCLFWFS